MAGKVLLLRRFGPLHPLVCALLALALLAPVALGAHRPKRAARFVFTFYGRGFGHGIGMPQFGAYGAALAGWSAARILGYYYQGTQLGTVPGGAVRVLVREGVRVADVTSDGAWQAIDEAATPNTAVTLQPQTSYRLTLGARGTVLRGPDGRKVGVFGGSMRLQPAAPAGTVTLGFRRFHGALRVLRRGGRLSFVDVVDLEQYLAGVVPREEPAKWGDDAPAALQAQAIAARTYALATLKPGADYDLYADERSQVYGGASDEDPRTTAAVNATRGQVVTYQGKVIVAYFFSSSGGRTEDVQNIFTDSGPRPYLTSVADPFDAASRYHQWPDPPTFSGGRLGRLLGLGSPVRKVEVVRRGASPRVLLARITTRRGAAVELTGVQLRRALGLRDTWFSVVRRPLTPRTSRIIAAYGTTPPGV